MLSGSWPFRLASAGNRLDVSDTVQDEGVEGGMTGTGKRSWGLDGLGVIVRSVDSGWG